MYWYNLELILKLLLLIAPEGIEIPTKAPASRRRGYS